MNPKKVGLVTPWFGRELKGGAESVAWELAVRLTQRGHSVTVITTCSRTFLQEWSLNDLEEGSFKNPKGSMFVDSLLINDPYLTSHRQMSAYLIPMFRHLDEASD